MTERLSIKTPDGDFYGHWVLPKSGKGPGLVLAQEIFGINRVMRKIADAFAEEGFCVLVPDLFWRFEKGVELGYTDMDWKKATDYYKAFDVDKGVQDMSAALSAVRRHPSVQGKVGVVGYCLGGLLAYLCACRTDCEAAVGYYGVGIDQHLEESHRIQSPLLLHFGERDSFVPLSTIERVEAALGKNTLVTIYRYPDADHAFARVGEHHYHPQAAEKANKRTINFLKKSLMGS